jgi:hypothetical protein
MSGRFTAEIFADSALRLGLFWNPAWLGIGKARQLTARALLPLFRGGGRGLLFVPLSIVANGDKRASGRRPGARKCGDQRLNANKCIQERQDDGKSRFRVASEFAATR